MSNKQTAVEFLVEQLETIIFYSDEAKENIIEQAKAIEKEQITKAYLADMIKVPPSFNLEEYAEHYYNKTYKQQDK